MKLDLYLEGPMQSWGVSEHWYKTRRTEARPTKTAIAGLIGRCMGVDWEETEKLQEISKSFEIIDSENTIIPMPKRMQDDQTIFLGDYIEAGLADGFVTGGGKLKLNAQNEIIRSQQFTKDYLEDEKIVITLEGSMENLSKIRNTLLHPVWPPYLGRACCIPSGQIVRGDIY